MGTGNGAGRSQQGDRDDGQAQTSKAHPGKGSHGRRWPIWAKVLGGGTAVLVGAALAFVIIQPITVLPRIRLSPGFSLVDQAGEPFTSETARGDVTLYGFAPLDCGEECDEVNETMRAIRQRAATEADLGETDLRLVTMALEDSPEPSELNDVALQVGADGEEWRVVGGEWDHLRTVVGSGFGRFFERSDDGTVDFDPGFVLVDGEGIIRAEYRYRTVSSDEDKIVRQIGILGEELRNSEGAAGVAYEAAHLFLCYD